MRRQVRPTPPAGQARSDPQGRQIILLTIFQSPFIGQAILAGTRRELYQRGFHDMALASTIAIQRRLKMLKDSTTVIGCITMVTGGKNEPDWTRLPFPVVNVSGQLADPPVPTVTMDNHAIGRLVAEYFLERGYRRLMFAVAHPMQFSRERLQGFADRAAEAGLPVSTEDPSALDRKFADLAEPLAILADGDREAARLIDAVHAAGRRVPDDVAVVGINNDRVLCEAYPTPISSVDPAARHIGTRAADLLCRLIDGEPPPPERILIRPAGIVERASSSALAVADPIVRRAVEYITANADRPLTTDDILEVVPVSRRTLENRFAAALGRSPHAELHRVRLENTKAMLIQTDLTIEEIAERTGYTNLHRFYKRFRAATDLTPGDYRKQFQ